MLWIIGAVAVMGAVAAGPIASDVEQAPYRVIRTEGNIELREYAPVIVAETETTGPRDEAIREGFKRIADYIFGNNLSKQKVAMTAPVLQQPSEKIAMTAPVLQQPDKKGWRVQFVMPAHYTLDTLPTPQNPTVQLRAQKPRHYAAITFSGIADDDSLHQHSTALSEYLRAHQLKAEGSPVFAFYNPPWTLPFMRRNEVLIPIHPARK